MEISCLTNPPRFYWLGQNRPSSSSSLALLSKTPSLINFIPSLHSVTRSMVSPVARLDTEMKIRLLAASGLCVRTNESPYASGIPDAMATCTETCLCSSFSSKHSAILISNARSIRRLIISYKIKQELNFQCHLQMQTGNFPLDLPTSSITLISG